MSDTPKAWNHGEPKKLKKVTLTVEILMEPEDGLGGMGLEAIGREVDSGNWSHSMKDDDGVIIEGDEAIKACEEQGTDPSFFFYE